ncbi:MAG: hypothetical protein CMH54_01860 [Myxococcales bacterium]|nr:hypothetical protein [Myxococcales bacterium]
MGGFRYLYPCRAARASIVIVSLVFLLGCITGDPPSYDPNGSEVTTGGPSIDTGETQTLLVTIEEPASAEETVYLSGDVPLAIYVDTSGPSGSDLLLSVKTTLNDVVRPGLSGDVAPGTTISETVDSLTELPDGEYVLQVEVSAPGFAPVGAQQIFRVDNTPPQLVWDGPPEGLVANKDVDVMVKYGDFGSGLDTLVVKVGTQNIHTEDDLGGAEFLGSTVPIVIDDFASGNYTIKVTVTDRVGHSTSSERSFRLVERPPLWLPDSYAPPGGGAVYDGMVTDLNGDGHEDLVISTSKQTVSYPGHADGTFGNAVEVSPASVQAFAIEDRTGDGIVDLIGIHALTAPSLLRVYVGQVHEQLGVVFGTSLDDGVSMDVQALDLQLADFNEDGLKDALLVTSTTANTLMLALGRPDGGFETPSSFGGINGTKEAHITDVDLDGHLDVVVLRNDTTIVSVYRGDGHGNFGIAIDTQNELPIHTATLADFDNDGRQDLVASQATGQGVPTIVIYSGQGAGTYSKTSEFPTLKTLHNLAVADIGGDGEADIMGLSPAARNLEIHYRKDGGFTFNDHAMYQAGVSPTALFVTDVNNDNMADPIILTGDAVLVLRSNLFGPRRAVREYHLVGRTIDADLSFANDDSNPDFLSAKDSPVTVDPASGVAQFPLLTLISKEDSLLANPSNATYTLPSLPEGPGTQSLGTPVQMVSPDFDLDNFSDAIIRMDGLNATIPTIFGFRRQGTNFYEFGSIYPDGEITTMTSGSLYGPLHRPQVIMSRTVPAGEDSTEEEYVLDIYDTGELDFVFRLTTEMWAPGTDITIADINDDGLKDIFVLQPDLGNVAFLRSLAGGDIQTAINYAVGPAPKLVRIDELTGDEHPDLIVSNAAGVLVAAGHGNGDFDPPVVLPESATTLTSLQLHDLNDDGFQDIVGADANQAQLLIQMSSTDGTYSPTSSVTTTPNVGGVPSGGIFVGDSNGDGCDDIVVIGPQTSVIARYLNSRCLE